MTSALQVSFGLLLLHAVTATAPLTDEAVALSLASDSECQGDAGTCALNALQVQRRALGGEAANASADVAGVSLASSCNSASDSRSLLKCADDTVALYGSKMASNLYSNSISRLDLAWPGVGYNQAAYGGMWQVMKTLEREYSGPQVQNIVGASGGASSALLALVDSQGSASTMVDVLMSSLWQSGVGTSGEYDKYKELLSTGNWAAVKNHGYAAMVCDSKSSVMAIVHDFRDKDQAAKAFAASGDVPSMVTGLGYNMGGAWTGCHDGSGLMGISNPLMYFNADYGHAGSCDKACVAELFKKAVKATVGAALSPNLQIGSGGGGSIAVQNPHGGRWTLQQYDSYESSGGFWDILINSFTSERVFVEGSSLSSSGEWWSR